MIRIYSETIEQEITAFIRDWTKLLSQERYKDACHLLDIPKEAQNLIHWNPCNLRTIISDYGDNAVISDPYSIERSQEKLDFYYYTDGSGVAVDYDLPINGKWSDLTAQFSFVKSEEDMYAVYLEGVHVL